MEGNEEKKEFENNNDKPALLKAVEIILANPADIKKEALGLYRTFAASNPSVRAGRPASRVNPSRRPIPAKPEPDTGAKPDE